MMLSNKRKEKIHKSYLKEKERDGGSSQGETDKETIFFLCLSSRARICAVVTLFPAVTQSKPRAQPLLSARPIHESRHWKMRGQPRKTLAVKPSPQCRHQMRRPEKNLRSFEGI